jgi:hypothetical protein
MATSTTADKLAAGPLTLVSDWLIPPTTIPPIIPEINPEINGAPLARAIPRHNGRATRKTTIPAGTSFSQLEKRDLRIGIFPMIFSISMILFVQILIRSFFKYIYFVVCREIAF